MFSLAGVTVTNQAFSAVTQESGEFQTDPADGLMGLAFQSISQLNSFTAARHINPRGASGPLSISPTLTVVCLKMSIHFTALDVLVVLLAAFVWYILATHNQNRLLPPGPSGLPLVGNVFDMPTAHEWKTFAKWGEIWGDIISVKLLGQPMVILNSYKHAVALLDKKSSIYSDRPTLHVAGEFIGWARSATLCRYGPYLRDLRRLFAQFIGTRENMSRFVPLVEHETAQFLLRLLREKDSRNVDVAKYVRMTAGAIILDMSYGYKTKEEDDPLVETADLAVAEFGMATTPGAFLADLMPILMYIPEWFPGAGWKKKVNTWANNFANMCELPFEYVKQQMAAGTASPSFTSMHLEGGVDAEREYLIKMAASAIYAGGADTTVSAISSFFLAMILHPEVQKKAQAEIDAFVGNDRLPCLADRDSLPYVNALCKEVARWNPVGPLGLPHRLTKDDVYEGYVLPKGTIVIANIWNFLHDADAYAEPFSFKPERFISTEGKEAERNPVDAAFGFGRRRCPGFELADSSVFLSCAMTLAVLDVSKAENDPILSPDQVEFTTGTISHPPPFKCAIKPRSAQAEALLRSVQAHMRD